MDDTYKELKALYDSFPDGFSSQTKTLLIEAYGTLRLAKANEILAASINHLLDRPLSVETMTKLSGEVSVDLKEKRKNDLTGSA